MRWQKSWQTQAGAAVLVLLFFALPTSVKVTTDFILEPGARAEIRTRVPGLIQDVRVKEGQLVERGELLAKLHNPEIEARAEILARQVLLAEHALGAAQSRADWGAVEQHARDRQRLAAELGEAQQKRAELELRAPFRGLVITPQIAQRVGEYLREGEEFCLLVNRDVMQARVLVPDAELEDVSPEAPAKLKVSALPLKTFTGRVKQILPAAALDRPLARPEKIERRGQELFNYFAVTLEFPNPTGQLQEGMTGTAKVYGRRYPLAWRAARSVWRWGRSQIWF